MTGRWRPSPLIAGSVGLHAVGALALAAAPASWPAVAGVLVADHVLLSAAGLFPRSRVLGPNVTRLGPQAAARGEVALTFDDGPDPSLTPRVLDLLEARDARGSFFAVGRRARAFPEIVREAAARGHGVENHTQHHPHAFAFYGPARLRREVREAQDTLAELAGRRPAFFRAPAGIRSPLLEPVLAAEGLQLASWTRRGYDAVSRDPAGVSRRLLRGLRAGDVLQMHDGAGRGPVLAVLPRVLDALEAAGLRGVPLR